MRERFKRLDNGAVHWFDLDLPDVVELRRRFFADSDRRKTLACSILDSDWVAAVLQSPGPYCFVAETVFVYLTEQEVEAALAQIARNFPSAVVAFDTVTRRAIEHANKDHEGRKLAARFVWACEEPTEIERWQIGLRLVESLTMMDIPDSLWSRLPLLLRAAFCALTKMLRGSRRPTGSICSLGRLKRNQTAARRAWSAGTSPLPSTMSDVLNGRTVRSVGGRAFAFAGLLPTLRLLDNHRCLQSE